MTMSTQNAVRGPGLVSYRSELAAVGRILLGATAGMVIGLLAGFLTFNSLVMALVGGGAGAISGVIAPARAAEGQRAEELSDGR
jgi:hypothetical protein